MKKPEVRRKNFEGCGKDLEKWGVAGIGRERKGKSRHCQSDLAPENGVAGIDCREAENEARGERESGASSKRR